MIREGWHSLPLVNLRLRTGKQMQGRFRPDPVVRRQSTEILPNPVGREELCPLGFVLFFNKSEKIR